MITEEELQLSKNCIRTAAEYGADSCRVVYSRNTEDLISVLDGEVDKITSCQDRAITFYVFTKGRFGCFSTNKTDLESIRELVRKSIPMIQMLSEDKFRCLPDPEICCKTAVTGSELELCDDSYLLQRQEDRIKRALSLCLDHNTSCNGYKPVSEEGEYSDSLYESLTLDTNGLECRHSETSFDYWVEVTVEDENGDKYSASHWTSSPFLSSFDAQECGPKALEKVASRAGSSPIQGGKYNMVVDRDVASRFVSPLLNALNGYNLQQHNSFLEGSLGRKIFPEGLDIIDTPHVKSEGGSKLFDEEGVATKDIAIIEKGVVKTYFINKYMSGKLKMEQTIEDAVRPALQPWPSKGLDSDAILKLCGSGIYVTDFNGGNFNAATGDFSYGIEGFYFQGGIIVKPVNEMLVTGNLLSLWASFIASGDDARRCCVKLIPTLAFKDVDFNGNDQIM